MPRATYRVQLSPDFGFDQVAGIAAYLARLGVSHLYSSPYLQAAPGSTHGYDVVDHSQVNVELGGEAGHERLCVALGENRLGQVLDVVPNHMAIAGRRNRWWWDVLENGRSSRYATYFDIAWDPPEPKLKNTILVPVLADHYGREVEAGRIRLARDGVRLLIRYFEHEFPIDPRTYDQVLGGWCPELSAAFAALPVLRPSDRAGASRRHRDKEALLERLAHLNPEAQMDGRIAAINADPDLMDELLDPQNYRLARWQTAGYELDYRRFFDVNSLVALRMEDPDVFEDTHVLLCRWLHDGVLDGLRIDHPDGLRDPLDYVSRLRAAAPRAWIVVEKILERAEEIPETWPVEGTTGYEFMNRALGLFVDPAQHLAMTEIYITFTGEAADYRETVYRSKHLVMRDLLATDLSRLTSLFVQVCEGNRRYRDYTRHELIACLREVIACLPVYRTYVRPGDPVSLADRGHIEQALAEAQLRRPELDPELLAFLGRILLLNVAGEHTAELVARFQQTSGPVMAKGVEDTALYTFNRLVALNEVGGDPGTFGTSPGDFHAASLRSLVRWPAGMLSTSTHDTKRGEDVRARLAVLSEMPGAWRDAVVRWAAINEPRRHDGMLDRNAEYLFYQTLVGAWPISVERATAYMDKAVHEAKAHTSWISPDPSYDTALRAFVEGSMEDPEFVHAVEEFLPPVVAAGRVNSLALKLLCLTAPGVPDVYQGTELWDLSLVDPDNRRPVDFERRSRLLEQLDAAGPAAAQLALSQPDEGLPKLLVVSRALRLRAARPNVFAAGDYQPLVVRGQRARHVLAFARGGEVVTVVPRLVATAAGKWGGTSVQLPEGQWTSCFDGRQYLGGRASLAELFGGFPVALLARSSV